MKTNIYEFKNMWLKNFNQSQKCENREIIYYTVDSRYSERANAREIHSL